MHKHAVMWVVVGWLIAVVFPPSALMGLFRGVSNAPGA